MSDKTTSEHICQVVDEGQKSEYWKVIESRCREYIKAETEAKERLLRSTVSEEDRQELNIMTERIKVMEFFLRINKTVIQENLGIIERARNITKEIFSRIKPSFVGNRNGH